MSWSPKEKEFQDARSDSEEWGVRLGLEEYIDVILVTSVMSNSAIPQMVACQAPQSMGFSRQEYWSGLPCPSPDEYIGPG